MSACGRRHGGTRGVGENQMATWLTASESSVPLAEDTIMRMITFTRYDSTLCAQATKLGPCLYLAPVGPLGADLLGSRPV